LGIVLLVRLPARRVHLLRDLVPLAEERGAVWVTDLKYPLLDMKQASDKHMSKQSAGLTRWKSPIGRRILATTQ